MSYKARELYKELGVARDYDRSRFEGLKGRFVDWREKKLIHRTIRAAGVYPPAKVLDVPCGTGRLSLFLAEMGYQVVGVDISQAMIDRAKNKLNEAAFQLITKFKVGDIECLPFPDLFFDVAISLRLFGHLPSKNRQNALREMSRVSKSFVVTAYYHKHSLQGLLRKRMRTQKGISWYPADFHDIDKDHKAANLKRVAKFFLLPAVSETLLVLGRKVSGS